MADELLPSGNIFRGLNKRIEESDLPDDQSADCVNCDHFEDRIGTLGPRRGKRVVVTEAENINGLGIYNLLNGDGSGNNKFWAIGYTNGSITFEIAIDQPTGGITVTTTTPASVDKLICWTTGSVAENLDENEWSAYATTTCNISIAGLKSLVAQAVDFSAISAATLEMDIQFDGGGWVPLLTAGISDNCCGVRYNPTNIYVDCSGCTAITGLRIRVRNLGVDDDLCSATGIVYINVGSCLVADITNVG